MGILGRYGGRGSVSRRFRRLVLVVRCVRLGGRHTNSRFLWGIQVGVVCCFQLRGIVWLSNSFLVGRRSR